MITAQEIMDAVSKGGSENWRPQCEMKSYSRYQHKPITKTQEKDANMLVVMGKTQWTVSDLAVKLKIRDNACRDALNRQMLKGKVKRSVNSQPYKYWVI